MASCKPAPKKDSALLSHAPVGQLVADTIIYPVDVVNLDTADTWANARIKNLQHDKLINLIFESLYNGTAKALDYYSQEPISIKQLKEMEKSGKITRNEAAQLQFEEAWYFNADEAKMSKEVQSILLAWPVYDNQDIFQAYKAGFVIKLNTQ